MLKGVRPFPTKGGGVRGNRRFPGLNGGKKFPIQIFTYFFPYHILF